MKCVFANIKNFVASIFKLAFDLSKSALQR